MEKKEKEIQKTLSVEETKNFIFSHLKIGNDPQQVMEKLGEKTIPIIKYGSEKEQDEAWKEIQKQSEIVLRAYENNTSFALMESVDEKYREFARELTKQIKIEHNCTTPIEQSLSGVITSSYIRFIDNSRRLNNELNCRDITPNKNKYISNLSIQADRAHRQFLQSILALKQLKTPSVGINIKTDNAFISSNQQFNANKENNDSK